MKAETIAALILIPLGIGVAGMLLYLAVRLVRLAWGQS